MREEALKLADSLDLFHTGEVFQESADMIRKLVAELEVSNSKLDKVIPKLVKANGLIENLRELLEKEAYKADLLENRLRVITGKELNKQDKPIAWWDGKHFASKEKSSLADIPLYTAPQTKPKCHKCWDSGLVGGYSNESMPKECSCKSPQTKPLSDEEIKQLAKHYLDSNGYEVFGIMGLARAIEERHGIK